VDQIKINEKIGHVGPVLKVCANVSDGKQSFNIGKKVISLFDPDTNLKYNLWQTTDTKLISTIENHIHNVITITGEIKKIAIIDKETDEPVVDNQFILFSYEVTDEIVD